MPGGQLNFFAEGTANVFLNVPPEVSLFRKEYKKATTFALQRFRIDYFGQRNLRLLDESTFQFKIEKYADLLMDTYVVINLPNIYSPVYPPTSDTGNTWSSYDFKWIEDLGTQMIKEITITSGSFTLQKYSGQYLNAFVQRNFTAEKKALYDRATGNVPEMNDPANAFGRTNTYPSVQYTENVLGAEPSIRGRQLYIPINSWFSLDSALGFPMVNLQYNELYINVTFRPIMELFVVRDIFDYTNNFPYIQPDQNRQELQIYHFLQSPPAVDISNEASPYVNLQSNWNADIHIMATYCFLSEAEQKVFAEGSQEYLVKDVFQYELLNAVGSGRIQLKSSTGMVSAWMWYFQRNDAYLRNEWSNYTNWPYKGQPVTVQLYINPETDQPLTNPDNTETGIFITGDFNVDNQSEIMQTFGIILDGNYREDTRPSGVYNYIEKYVRTKGNAKDGLYCYHFGLGSDPAEYQPMGAMNMSKFRTIELEFTTYVPPIDPQRSQMNIICNANGDPIGVSKQNYQLLNYGFNMVVFEERYNIIKFESGYVGMLYNR